MVSLSKGSIFANHEIRTLVHHQEKVEAEYKSRGLVKHFLQAAHIVQVELSDRCEGPRRWNPLHGVEGLLRTDGEGGVLEAEQLLLPHVGAHPPRLVLVPRLEGEVHKHPEEEKCHQEIEIVSFVLHG